jgi:hypothetical protein
MDGNPVRHGECRPNPAVFRMGRGCPCRLFRTFASGLRALRSLGGGCASASCLRWPSASGGRRVPGLPVPSPPDVCFGPPGPSLTRRWLRFGILPTLATYAGETARATPPCAAERKAAAAKAADGSSAGNGHGWHCRREDGISPGFTMRGSQDATREFARRWRQTAMAMDGIAVVKMAFRLVSPCEGRRMRRESSPDVGDRRQWPWMALPS